jgi:hypothetical protein
VSVGSEDLSPISALQIIPRIHSNMQLQVANNIFQYIQSEQYERMFKLRQEVLIVQAQSGAKKAEVESNSVVRKAEMECETTIRKTELDNQALLRKTELDNQALLRKTDLDNVASIRRAELDTEARKVEADALVRKAQLDSSSSVRTLVQQTDARFKEMQTQLSEMSTVVRLRRTRPVASIDGNNVIPDEASRLVVDHVYRRTYTPLVGDLDMEQKAYFNLYLGYKVMLIIGEQYNGFIKNMPVFENGRCKFYPAGRKVFGQARWDDQVSVIIKEFEGYVRDVKGISTFDSLTACRISAISVTVDMYDSLQTEISRVKVLPHIASIVQCLVEEDESDD